MIANKHENRKVYDFVGYCHCCSYNEKSKNVLQRALKMKLFAFQLISLFDGNGYVPYVGAVFLGLQNLS